MTSMKQHEVAQFVADLLAAGLTILAFGRDEYLIYDDKLPQSRRFDVEARLGQISTKYGDRRHLSKEIVWYLRSMGHVYRPSEDMIR